MYKVIYDCDNTMGMTGKDVDDGLTLMYLLGNEDVDLVGVTSTHGNSSVEDTHSNNLNLMNYLDKEYKPIFKGGDIESGRISEAAKYLAVACGTYPGEITVLATGSMSNLYGAYLYDENFYKNVKNIIIMGGVLNKLSLGGVNIKELNLSCDYEAAYEVLKSKANITLFTGEVCLKALFGEKELDKLKGSDNKVYSYIYNNIKDWYSIMYEKFGMKGFCNWDAAAALYIVHKELFKTENVYINPIKTQLKEGIINIDSNNKNKYKVTMATDLVDLDKFNDLLLKSWANISLKE
ncbi:nucleoside hydrolase [Clostridium oceanicum]|uniref:Nucleoside hydrolase n=1 Tax=Clostridium oceanicum TaxID=1543 RepID=A0ABP3V0Q7_9CLOT